MPSLDHIQTLCFGAGKPELNPKTCIREQWLHMQITVKNRLIIQLTIGLAMLIASISDAQVTEAPTNTETESIVDDKAYSEISEQVKVKTTEDIIAEHFSDAPILKKIAFCESQNRQIDETTGAVLRGKVNSQDVGVMQINEKYHLEAAKKLGLDIYTLEGNIDYAKHLYKTQGVKPWVHSSKCWDKSNEFALR